MSSTLTLDPAFAPHRARGRPRVPPANERACLSDGDRENVAAFVRGVFVFVFVFAVVDGEVLGVGVEVSTIHEVEWSPGSNLGDRRW